MPPKGKSNPDLIRKIEIADKVEILLAFGVVWMLKTII